jgi:hypothetical protein
MVEVPIFWNLELMPKDKGRLHLNPEPHVVKNQRTSFDP